MLVNRGMDKKRCSTYIQRDITQPSKKEQTNAFAATWMDLGNIILCEVSQRNKDKYHMITLIRGILKMGTNELIYKTEVETQM